MHYSEEYAKETEFGKPILPGLLSISIFSKIFGNNLLFPKAILVSIDCIFLKPMYADENYQAEVIFDSILDKHKAKILTKIYGTKTNNLTVDGHAVIKSEIIF